MALAGRKRIRAEQVLRQAMTTGKGVDLRTGKAEADDPARGATWEHRRMVPAELLAALVTQPGEGQSRPRALRLARARITGALDLAGAELVCPLTFYSCWFEQPINLSEARAPAVRLPGCNVPGLQADQLETRGDLQLSDGFTSQGLISLFGAQIGGRLSLVGAQLKNQGGLALLAERIVVQQDMLCNGLVVEGAIGLGGHIHGLLDFSGARLSNVDG